MQRTTFVAQPAHFSMSAMRRILSPSASSTSNLTTSRAEPVQANQPISCSSVSTSSTSSPTTTTTTTTTTTHTPSSCPTHTSPPVFHQPRKPRGSLSSPPAHPVIPAHTSCLTYPADAYHTPSDEEHTDDDTDDADDDHDEYDEYDEYDDDLYDADPMYHDVPMWRRWTAGDARSDPVAIPNAHFMANAHRALTHLPALPDPTPIVSSYLVRAASGEDDADAMSRRMCGGCMQRSPFAPPVAFDDITPGKPEMHDVSARRMAYFDEDALY